MKIYFIISLIPCLYYLIFKSKKAMHMLQQNWYNDGNRYFKWVIDNERKVFITYDLLFILFALLKFFKFNISAAIFIFFYLCVYYLYKNSIKKSNLRNL